MMLHTQANDTMLQRILGVLGNRLKSNLDKIELSDENQQSGENNDTISLDHTFTVKGYISKPIPGAGRSSSDKQYIYINGRPCDLPSVRFLH